ANCGTGLALGHRADHLEFGGLVTVFKTHLVHFTIAAHGDFHITGQCVHHRYSHTVQTAGEVVVFVGELATGVQAREDQFHTGYFFFRVNVHGHTTAVVLDFDGAILVQGQCDVFGKTGERFVNTVVDNFLHQVVGSGGIGIHAGAFTHRIKAGEDFNSIGVITFAHKPVVLKRRNTFDGLRRDLIAFSAGVHVHNI